ncbi:MAG TPA: carbon-nitrogen hydrolase family protein [Gemmataceae bacterium]|nr:carbon-nitrogen hydrolase family protein [Gemmataceae bacterium]
MTQTRTIYPATLVVALLTGVTARSQPPLPDGWSAAAPRDEIRPAITHDPKGGPGGAGAFVITTDDGVGQHGWVRKSFPVTGGTTYRFQARRRTENVESPRRSAGARIVWLDKAGKQVPADVPPGREKEYVPVPSAEPEHPLDGETDKLGWTPVAGVYRSPAKATQAVVELHLQWAPKAQARWGDVSFVEVPPVPARKVRLATIHHKPSGKSPQANCEEFAPLVAEAAKRRADLVVLGETVHYVGVGKKPHEVAEPVPGPSTRYFGELAKAHALHVVVSLYERDGRAVYNVAVLIGPDGGLIGKYRKVCLPHAEVEAGVMPGKDYPVFETKLGKVGLMVCYDGFFPEVARELTNRGAEVIAWPVWGCDPLLARARANENRVFVVSSTYMEPKANWMLSAVYDRTGTPLATADKWGAVVVAEVDLNERRIGPYNLGAFHDMVQRHRPVPVPEPVGEKTRPPGR